MANAACKWFVVVDGQEEKHYDAIEQRTLVFSPDSQRLTVIDGWCVVVDGQEQKEYEGLSTLVFSPDSQRLSYVAREIGSGKQFVVVDEEEEEHYDNVEQLVFSPDSHRVAYVAERFEGALFPIWKRFALEKFVVVDGQDGKHYDHPLYIRSLTFSPDSQRSAYVVLVWMGGRGSTTKAA